MEKTVSDEYAEIKRGELMAFSSGAYSDYNVGAFSRALSDFNFNDEVTAWEKETNPYGDDPDDIQNKYLNWDSMTFQAWIERKGLIESLDYKEVHTGSYGRFQIDLGNP